MPQGVEIKSLDDIPGFAQQMAVPGMKIAPLTAPTPNPVPADPTALTPTYNVNEVVNSSISSLQDIRRAQQESARAATEALAKNTLIQQQVYDENVRQQDIIMKAVENIQKIRDRPFGEILGIFDPKNWSIDHQHLEIKKAELRSQQTTLRGQAQININNQLPALKAAEVEAAQAGFQYTKDMFGVLQNVTELDQKTWQLRLNAVDLRLKLSQEDRTIRDEALKGMTVQQAKAELRRAQKGEGDWAGMAGLLEDKIDRDEKNDLDVAQARQQLAAGKFDLAQKTMTQVVSGIEYSEGLGLVNQALADGSQTVKYKGLDIPLGIMVTGVEQARKISEALTSASLANSAYGVNERLQKLVTQNSALALSNPNAANNLQAIIQFRARVDPTNPAQMQQFNAFLTLMEAQTKTSLEQQRDAFTTPQAKAAYENFIKNGFPDPGSAHAVVEEALAQPTIGARGKLAKVWDILRRDYATRVQQLNPTNMPSFNMTSNQGILQFLQWQRTNQNKDLADIRAEVVQSGQFNDQINDAVDGVFQMDAVKSVLDGLSTTPGPGASVYLNLVRDPRRMLDAAGNIDPAKLATYLSQQTVLNGNKADYLQTFIEGLKTHSTQAASLTADPSMTVEDLHLLTNIYGVNPFGTIMSGFVSFMAEEARIQRNNMDEAIRQDVTGETQRRARAAISQDIDSATLGAILQSTPSATGIGTADEIKAIYGTDPRFGSMIPQGPGGRR